jgi:hypothetical protein
MTILDQIKRMKNQKLPAMEFSTGGGKNPENPKIPKILMQTKEACQPSLSATLG